MVELFLINYQEKNKWKQISRELSFGCKRHPTEIKNRFYSMIRRGLRRVNNFLGKHTEPHKIRVLKPKSISVFIEQKDHSIS